MTNITKKHLIELFIRIILFGMPILSYVIFKTKKDVNFQNITYVLIWLFFISTIKKDLIKENIK